MESKLDKQKAPLIKKYRAREILFNVLSLVAGFIGVWSLIIGAIIVATNPVGIALICIGAVSLFILAPFFFFKQQTFSDKKYSLIKNIINGFFKTGKKLSLQVFIKDENGEDVAKLKSRILIKRQWPGTRVNFVARAISRIKKTDYADKFEYIDKARKDEEIDAVISSIGSGYIDNGRMNILYTDKAYEIMEKSEGNEETITIKLGCDGVTL